MLIPQGEISIPVANVVLPLSVAVDLISPEVFNHHIRVAYTAHEISKLMGFSFLDREKIFLASALHDIGALSLKERLEALRFESIYTPDVHWHAKNGFKLLRLFEPFERIAKIVKYHHYRWEYGKGKESEMGEPIPIESHIVHLADRVDSLFRPEGDVLQQAQNVRDRISKLKGSVFLPEAVEAFLELSYKEYFWFDLSSKTLANDVYNHLSFSSILIDEKNLNGIAKLFSHIIDFRSRYTATHSAGVSAVAEKLAKAYKFSLSERDLIVIAGYLHDLGKLAVPVSVLEAPRKLTEEEYNLIKKHPFYTYRILEKIKGFELINAWGALHHERIDGSGYPFRLKEASIPLGAIIMAVSDVYTALTEDRPYREGMSPSEAIRVLEEMASERKLCSDAVYLLKENLEEIDEYRRLKQEEAFHIYEGFWSENEGD